MRFDLSWARRVGSLALALGVLFWASGCGSSVATVAGKVTYDGKPLKGGNVTFVGAEGGGGGSAEIQEDGTYKVERLPVGPMKVLVDTESLNPSRKPRVPQYTPPPGQEGPGGYKPSNPADKAKRYVKIPAKYAKTATTDLTYTVKGGSQNYDIPLNP